MGRSDNLSNRLRDRASPELGNRSMQSTGRSDEESEPRSSGQPWTREDDETLIGEYLARGDEWDTICRLFPTRTPHACRGRIGRLKEKGRVKADDRP